MILALDPGNEETAVKSCTQCHAAKPLDQFYKNPITKDGRGSWCHGCEKARNRKGYVRNYSKTDAAKVAQVKYRSSSLGKASIASYGKHARVVSPLQARARDVLNGAVRCGRVKRPASCSECGKSARVQAHHHDYAKPLDVIWLCVWCHAKAHHE